MRQLGIKVLTSSCSVQHARRALETQLGCYNKELPVSAGSLTT